MSTDGSGLYGVVRSQSKIGAACLDSTVDLIRAEFDEEITDSEKLYVLMHIMRISRPRA